MKNLRPVEFELSPREAQAFREAVADSGLSQEEFLRRAAREFAIGERPAVSFREVFDRVHNLKLA